MYPTASPQNGQNSAGNFFLNLIYFPFLFRAGEGLGVRHVTVTGRTSAPGHHACARVFQTIIGAPLWKRPHIRFLLVMARLSGIGG